MLFRRAGEWLEDPDVAAIGGALGEYRFVGGAIRDALADREPGDLDMAVPIGPGETMSRLERAGISAHPTGYEHGVVLAVCGGRRIEVASLRRDVATDGRRAVVAYTADWREDAARRDFTMNAMSATPECGLFDYFDGRADLAEGRVRFVGDPERRIREDVLRALRYFRFLALFPGGERDGPSFEAAVRAAPLTVRLSGERLHDEVLRLLALPEPTAVVGEMVGLGFFEPFLPPRGTRNVWPGRWRPRRAPGGVRTRSGGSPHCWTVRIRGGSVCQSPRPRVWPPWQVRARSMGGPCIGRVGACSSTACCLRAGTRMRWRSTTAGTPRSFRFGVGISCARACRADLRWARRHARWRLGGWTTASAPTARLALPS